MRFLIDQDVYQTTIEFLKGFGHDVLRAKDVGLSTSSDREILTFAYQNQRVLITRDKDFGALVFVLHQNNPGVIFLRMDPLTIESTHIELSIFLNKHQHLKNYFCVIEPGCHRIRLIR